MAQPVPESVSFPEEEDKIYEFWKSIDAFRTSLKLSKGRPRYSFYDGPPFATGLPHYGHILAGTIKDVVTRWAHMSGFHVERRFGWDCHGLPVEHEIDKTLGIKGPDDVMKMGVKAYNDECRKIVSRYCGDWKEIISRLGRWIDFDNDYKSMYPWYMESIWWVFKQLYNKGLVYKGYKVMPFSTACNTPLSNFESGQDYRDVVDPAVIVSFPLEEDPNVKFVAWTTTPWTLPSNLALCVHPELDYVKVRDKQNNEVYIMMEARLEALFRSEDEYQVLEKFKGKMIEGKKYKPLFDYFAHMREKTGAFRVLTGTYVTTDVGTGIVHQSPFFGEDDYMVCLANGVIRKDGDVVCPVDASGCFTEEVTDFKGMYVKEADKHIIKLLKARGRLVHEGTCKHSYPFCWRSETPLIYKAVPSWFIRVEQAQEILLQTNSKTYWVPDFVKEKRFGNWLREARDWAVSRNRYWGTPVPIWVSEDGEEVVCVGSIEELKQLTGQEVTDLHRENVDNLTIPSAQGKGVLRRVTEVFDCWFESGSMPYAQAHYPFENKKEFEDTFPADFIAEGIDQTRGWFYTLLVLSTLLFGKPPFRNLVANGLVLASDGQKMSKRKKNYPDPMEVAYKYGADALRMYLINSPAVRAENLRFKEEGVRDVVKDVFLPWYNAYRFLMQNIERLEREEGHKFVFSELTSEVSTNYMDRWILSFTQSLIKYVTSEMAAYRLFTVMPRLVKFVDQLTNWYVRMNRRRLKGDSGVADCYKALETLFSVLFSMTRVMASFVPFITELMYQNMRHLLADDGGSGEETRSVHYLLLPKAQENLIFTEIETAVSRMQTVIELGRVIRDRKTLPLKYPLKEVVAICNDNTVLDDIRSLEKYILEELNIRSLTVTSDKQKYGVQLRAEPDHKVLGAKLKGALKAVSEQIRQLTDEQLTAFLQTGTISVGGYTLGSEDLRVMFTSTTAQSGNGDSSQYEAHSDGQVFLFYLVLLDVTPDQSMVDEGVAREVINRIQRLRKKAKLTPSDDIVVYYQASSELDAVVKQFSEYITSTTKQPLQPYPVKRGESVIISESLPIKNHSLEMTITQTGNITAASQAVNFAQTASSLSPAPVVSGVQPCVKFVNVQLCGKIAAGEGRTGTSGTLLLENPAGQNLLSEDKVLQQIQSVFGLRGRKIRAFEDAKLSKELSGQMLQSGCSLYVTPVTGSASLVPDISPASPVCCFANVEFGGKKATVLLENPRGCTTSPRELLDQVRAVYSLNGKPVRLSLSKTKGDILDLQLLDLLSLHSKQLYIV
ncbi:isoleucine--tRNA ligase, cytoplasmic-like [Pomacea canaliculata]|uniref:isoleucine--tRNA ligase, cytoplasmic-like n=1 Tax=Pomacea canaliculata TaxID=400727 RepID=UPI000D72E60B|nr:isoleucine--tRNA ligase, cytoplasmic-like [Pomacea canaliculata]